MSPTLARLGFQLPLLACMQALMLIQNVTMIAISGLAGMQLAPDKLLGTLPVTAYLLGGALWSMPVAAVMRRKGRRFAYTIGAFAGMAGALGGWWAMSHHSLAGLCAAGLLSGLYNACGASVRFAAADAADAWKPDFRARAISLVLAGGIAGGIVGPELTKWSRTWLDTLFAGSYLTLVGFAIAWGLLAQLIRLPKPSAAATQAASGAAPPRPLMEILRQPACWIAIVVASLGYGIMNLLMVATPLAMEVCSHPWSSTALVLEWHVIGMFAPGLVTGSIIARVGVLPVIVAGCALLAACIGIAVSGVELMQFLLALALLGIGWNFLYTGGTTLLTTAYKPNEKNKVQGFMDFCVFTTMITSSASSGALMHVNGWSMLNLVSLPLVVAMALLALWLGSRGLWRLGRAVPRAA